jgi:hypothetical protein
MERMNLNAVKSFIGKNVNLHLKDGSVIINVRIEKLICDEFNGRLILNCIPFRKKKTIRVPMRNVAWAETLSPILFQKPSEKA